MNKEESKTATLTDALTDSQIVNWRKVLVNFVGSYAFMMSREEIQSFRNELQSALLHSLTHKQNLPKINKSKF